MLKKGGTDKALKLCDVFIPLGTGKAAQFRDDGRDPSQDS